MEVKNMTVEARNIIESKIYETAQSTIDMLNALKFGLDKQTLTEFAVSDIRSLSVDSFLLVSQNYLHDDMLTAEETMLITEFTQFQITRILNTIN